MTDEPPAHLTDWKGEDWTPESGTPAAHPNARFTAPGLPGPGHRPGVGGPAGRARSSAILFGGRRASVVPAGLPVPRLGARRVPGLDHGVGDDGRRGRCRRQPAPRPLRHAAVLRLQHGRLLRPLAAASAPTRRPRRAAQDLLRQLVPQGRRRQVALARLRRQLPGARVGLRPGGRTRPRPSTRRSAPCPAPEAIDTDGPRRLAASRWTSSCGSTPRAGGPRCPSSASTTPSSATGCPPALADAGRHARGAPGLSPRRSAQCSPIARPRSR